MSELTHLDELGRARMVDVGAKTPSERRARARATVGMSPATAAAVARGDAPKGDVLGTARLAGIQAAKRTDELIPLAHPLPLTYVDLEAAIDVEAGTVTLEAEARTTARTGVEMEAMTACAVAALTVYDMVKGLERGVQIEQVVLLQKSGGKADWRRPEPAPVQPAHTTGHVADGPAKPSPPLADGALRAAVITISSSRAAGSATEDESGPLLAELARKLGATSIQTDLIPDDQAQIEARLRHYADQEGCRLILTTGGTGVAPSDVTPEATQATIDREIPGIGEAIRTASRPHTPNWPLSRATAGARGQTLIVNFPGSPRAISQTTKALTQPLAHTLALLAGQPAGH